jgi:hypothetical protein
MSPLRRNIYPDAVTPEQLQIGVHSFQGEMAKVAEVKTKGKDK